ncbi:MULTISPECIES: type IV secretion protein Rhs [Buttiauxella]|uniref:type IV secretion protein Rhs n=1 Tax=Buttiauxella TaxID=82976 RepID=UPI00106127E7|nr:type IV secretion protein Rhs [Buttiauxella sp. JUb87]TDN54008.1 hypothetical protein EC843_10149 [Buttiauxella sp. JUb87]
MTIDDEIKLHIANLPNPPEIIENWEPIADSLSDMFDWIGSKIDWNKTIGHVYQDLGNEKKSWTSLVSSFIHKYAYDLIFSSEGIFYINDSSLDFALKIPPDQMDTMLNLLIELVPQHHYFFDINNQWCLVVSSEGYVDFGVSKLAS